MRQAFGMHLMHSAQMVGPRGCFKQVVHAADLAGCAYIFWIIVKVKFLTPKIPFILKNTEVCS